MTAETVKKYKNVWTGGTFDHFHQGHRDLLDKAFEVSSFVTIGITTNELVADKKYSEFIEGLELRMYTVSSDLNQQYGKDRYKFVINDSVYTEAVFNPELCANIICFKTEHHGRNINRMREAKNIPPLDLVMAPSSAMNSSSSETRRSLYLEKYGHDPFAGKESVEPTVDRGK